MWVQLGTDWWRRRVCWLFPRRWRPSPHQGWKQNAPCSPDRKYTPCYCDNTAVLILRQYCSTDTAYSPCVQSDSRGDTLTKGTLFLSSWTARFVLDTETWITSVSSFAINTPSGNTLKLIYYIYIYIHICTEHDEYYPHHRVGPWFYPDRFQSKKPAERQWC